MDPGRIAQEWKDSIIVPIYEKGYRMDCNNYRGIYSCLLRIKFSQI